MSKDTRSIPAAFRGYLLPRSAHDSLAHTRDQLRLLAQFTEARSESSEYIVIPPDALSELFERTASYVDDAFPRHPPRPRPRTGLITALPPFGRAGARRLIRPNGRTHGPPVSSDEILPV